MSEVAPRRFPATESVARSKRSGNFCSGNLVTLVQEEDADDTGTSDGFRYFSRARGSALYWAGFTKSAGMSWNDALSRRPPPTFRLVKLRSQAAQQGRGAKDRGQHRQAAGAVRSEEPTSSDAAQRIVRRGLKRGKMLTKDEAHGLRRTSPTLSECATS